MSDEPLLKAHEIRYRSYDVLGRRSALAFVGYVGAEMKAGRIRSMSLEFSEHVLKGRFMVDQDLWIEVHRPLLGDDR